MSDDKAAAITEAPPDRWTDADGYEHLDCTKRPIEAPNVIDDTVPGGPRYFHNLGDEPIWIEKKSELKKIMDERGLVPAERNVYNKDDKSPWATRTRLRPDATDPFLPKQQQVIEQPAPEPVLLDADGRPLGSTHTLDYQTAATLRGYFSWIIRAGYEPELLCGSCFDGYRKAKMQFEVNEDVIDMACKCRRILYSGRTKWTKIAPTLPPTLPETMAHVFGPATLTLSLPEVEILRQWKLVLMLLGLKEALRCNRCFEQNHADGVQAAVTAAHVRIVCRCRVYTFSGYSY